MNKENNRSAAGLRRSAIAERIRLREEWSELKGTSDEPLTAANRLKQTNTLTKKQPIRNRKATPGSSNTSNAYNIRTNSRMAPGIKEVLMGVVALVEVGAEARALPLRAALTALGATVVPAWTPIVTHVIWAQGGCRATRAKARALASRLVSPLWVEACAASQQRLPEQTFPAAARASDLPSPRTLRQLLMATRAKERALASRLVSPLWVEACAASQQRLPEQTFPAAARASDLPSPRTLRQLLKKAEMENIPLVDLLPDKENEADGKATRLRLSSDTENDTSRDTSHDTSHDTSRDKSTDTSRDKSTDISRNKTENRVNTAPRRALPISISPPRPSKSRRKLFTNREADETKTKASDDESDKETNLRPPVRVPKPSTRDKRELARAERMARRLLAACTPAPAPAPTDQPRIVLTGMGKTERRTVANAIRTLNGRLQSHVTRKTTHVLLGSCRDDAGHCSGNVTVTSLDTKRRSPRNKSGFNMTGISTITSNVEPRVVHRSEVVKARTLNALLGAARGARVLTARWAIDSVSKGRWIHHHGYEVPHLRKISEKARIERTALCRTNSEYAYDVFNGMRVLISPSAEQKDAATQLLKLCGAIVQDGVGQQDGGNQNGGFDLTIGCGDGEVSSKWVFDSVAAARMRTTRRYVNNPLSNTLVTQTTDR